MLLFPTGFSLRLNSPFWSFCLESMTYTRWARVGANWQELAGERLKYGEAGWNGKKWMVLRDTTEIKSTRLSNELDMGGGVWMSEALKWHANTAWNKSLFCFSTLPYTPHPIFCHCDTSFLSSHNKETSEKVKTGPKGSDKYKNYLVTCSKNKRLLLPEFWLFGASMWRSHYIIGWGEEV